MIHKFRMFLLSVGITTILLACSPGSDSGSSEQESVLADTSVEQTEASANADNDEGENSTMISASSSDSEATADANTAAAEESDTAEEGSEAVEQRNAEAADSAAAQSQLEAMTEIQPLALESLIAKTHLEREGYSYSFAETESNDYIEIEVREILDEAAEHMTREGTYRYVFKTDEVLMQDYLTGDYIPYEQ